MEGEQKGSGKETRDEDDEREEGVQDEMEESYDDDEEAFLAT